MTELNIWRCFTAIGNIEELDKLNSLVAEKNLSREDLITILRAIELNPYAADMSFSDERGAQGNE